MQCCFKFDMPIICMMKRNCNEISEFLRALWNSEVLHRDLNQNYKHEP